MCAHETNIGRLDARTENIRGRCASWRIGCRNAEDGHNHLLAKATRHRGWRRMSPRPHRPAGRRASTRAPCRPCASCENCSGGVDTRSRGTSH